MLFTLILSSHRSLGFPDVSFQAVRWESLRTVIWHMCTIYYEMSSVRQARLKVFRRVRDWLRPHPQGVAGDFVETKPITRCPSLCCATSNTLKMGKETRHAAPKNLHILTRLSARRHFIEFCGRESFKTYMCHNLPISYSCSWCHNDILWGVWIVKSSLC